MSKSSYVVFAAAAMIVAMSAVPGHARGMCRVRYQAPVYRTAVPAYRTPASTAHPIRHGYHPQMFRDADGYGEG